MQSSYVNRLRTSRHPLGIQEVRSIITPCGGNYNAISKEHRCVSTSTFFFLALCLSSQVSTKDRVKLKQREKKSALTLCPFIPGSPGVPGNPRAPCKSNTKNILSTSHLQIHFLLISVCGYRGANLLPEGRGHLCLRACQVCHCYPVNQ